MTTSVNEENRLQGKSTWLCSLDDVGCCVTAAFAATALGAFSVNTASIPPHSRILLLHWGKCQ